jgi:sulfonate transport system ATP-binding protein
VAARAIWRPGATGGDCQRTGDAPLGLTVGRAVSALDAFTRSELQDHLLDLWDEERPILILVTHDIEEALVLASRIAVMRSHPGCIAGIIDVPLPRPRDRLSPAFEDQKRRVLRLLDSTLSPTQARLPQHDF